jgi:hypothetical protein
MAFSRLLSFSLAIASAAVFGVSARAELVTGPVSPYYLDGYGSTIYVVQGLSVVASFPTAYGQGEFEQALAVGGGTIRTRAGLLSGGPDGLSGEYTLDGIPTGTSYLTPPSGSLRYYDGTSSGPTNFFVDHGVPEFFGGVYKADRRWQDPQFLFYAQGICDHPPDQPGCHGLSGVAFDPLNHSLWVSSRPDSRIQEYSMGGKLLAQFTFADPFSYNAALGVDPMDHTLWMTTGGTGFLRQYSLDPSTFGMLLQSGIPAGLPDGRFLFDSGDFNHVPEPSSALLIAAGISALAALRCALRRKRPRSAGSR